MKYKIGSPVWIAQGSSILKVTVLNYTPPVEATYSLAARRGMDEFKGWSESKVFPTKEALLAHLSDTAKD